jgi:hypothetical protein
MSFQDEGFLSDTLNHCFREMTECSEWFNLAFRLNRWAHRFALTEREFEVEGNGLADVKALTSMLFFRALSNFQGCIVLADRGLIVEARTLARSCGESALSMFGAKFDPDHWKALMDDEVKSRRSRARLLMGNSHWMTPAPLAGAACHSCSTNSGTASPGFEHRSHCDGSCGSGASRYPRCRFPPSCGSCVQSRRERPGLYPA